MRWCLLLAVFACDLGDEIDEDLLPADESQTESLALGCPGAPLTVAQVNICESGKWQDCVTNRTPTWGTQDELADRMTSASLAGISVIGVEEMNVDAAPRLATVLTQRTGAPWTFRHVAMGLNGAGSGAAIYWRADVHALAEDFGYVQVEEITYPDPAHAHYKLRFMGLLLRHLATGKTFGMFAGKTAWGGLTLARKPIDNARRGVEATTLRMWIRSKMEAHPDSTSILAIDTTPEGTPAWDALNLKFDDGNPSYGGTHPAASPTRRYDQLFWDYDLLRKKRCGFIDGPRRASPFGSDHRFVWATVVIK